MVDPATETWYLRNSNSGGAPDYTAFRYGAPGWIPVVGDWNGTGHTGIGVFDPSTGTWYLRNEVGPGAPDAGQFAYGGAGWTPVVGDWTGQGKDTIGVVDPSRHWYLRNSNDGGAPSLPVFAYGGYRWGAVVGDWDFPALPQLAAGGEATVPSGAAPLTEAQLQTEVQVALNLLASDGVNPGLLAQLGSLQFTVGQLPAGTLGLSEVATGQVEISADAAGYGWFVDANPLLDQAFVNGVALPGSAAANRMDLLTVVLHEMGHFDGWTELDPATHPDALMALTLGTGQRRTQDIDAVFAAGL